MHLFAARTRYTAMDTEFVHVEVAYATPRLQSIVELQLAAPVTAREAALESGLQAEYPELDLERCPLGVFGKQVSDERVLRDGDRVEIYRPLVNEPREARRKAAARGGTMGAR